MNARTFVQDNDLSGPRFIRILPFGGFGGFFSDLIATGVWYTIIVLMVLVFFTTVRI